MPDVAVDLPRTGGAYVLLICLKERLALEIPAFRDKTLEPGHYAYCGSAYGPGGIRARVSRHLRADKSMRWHVDRLTAAGRLLQIGVRVSGRECDLVAELQRRGGLMALSGFGSSDCAKCAAHLVHLPGGVALPTGIFDLVVPPQLEPHGASDRMPEADGGHAFTNTGLAGMLTAAPSA